MKTIQELIGLSSSYLQERKVERPRRCAEELLAHALQMKRLDLYLAFDRPVSEAEYSVLRDWLKRIVKGEPFEYVVGEVFFFGARIRVDSRVLIPRPETEILADWISKRIRGKILWDVCTGPGTLGISLKKKFPSLQVALSDLSSAALTLAKQNAEINGVDVEILEGDLFAPFRGRCADAVVCNPPYISEKEYLHLPESVLCYEPKMALVGGERGVEFYERLSRDGLDFLNEGGQLFLEIGSSQGEVVKQIFNSPKWGGRELLKDWSGKDRFFFLEKQ